MELTKNIFFNTDKLVENTTVKISYVGTLFQNNSEVVTIHYGFGPNWDNVSDVKMEKTELGFQAEINLLEGDTFNFCFNNENGIWDNNDGYYFHMQKSISLFCMSSTLFFIFSGYEATIGQLKWLFASGVSFLSYAIDG